MILDLFAGPGGWDEGLRLLGHGQEVIGFELDKAAAATAEAAGFKRVLGDLRDVQPTDYTATGLIASPPCQTFAQAGPGEGKGSLDALVEALSYVADGHSCQDAVTICGLDEADPRSSLVLQPMRFIRDLHPRWVAMEEVKGVLPVWLAYMRILEAAFGYSCWAGILNAADYGLPQSRKRAFLLANLDGPAHPPAPTHDRDAEWTLFDQRVEWVTMAQALDWTAADCRRANICAGPKAQDSELCLWPLHRPATTVVRSFRPDVIAAPGYRTLGSASRQNAPGSVAVTPEELCILQGIRTDYPFQAKGGKRLSLIGAVLPPPWAAAILQPLVG